MFGLGFGEFFLICALGLIFIGPKKIPELARGLGRGLREFQKAKDEMAQEFHSMGELPSSSREKSEEKVATHTPGKSPDGGKGR